MKDSLIRKFRDHVDELRAIGEKAGEIARAAVRAANAFTLVIDEARRDLDGRKAPDDLAVDAFAMPPVIRRRIKDDMNGERPSRVREFAARDGGSNTFGTRGPKRGSSKQACTVCGEAQFAFMNDPCRKCGGGLALAKKGQRQA